MAEVVGLKDLPRARLDEDHHGRRGGEHVGVAGVEMPVEAHVFAVSFGRTRKLLRKVRRNPGTTGPPARRSSVRTIEVRIKRPTNVSGRNPKKETREDQLLLDIVRHTDWP